jgi:hypothetical protein
MPGSSTEPTEQRLTGAERVAVLADIYEVMGVDPCCGEDPGLGMVGVLGFEFGSNRIFVQSGEFAFLAEGLTGAARELPLYWNDDATVVLLECADNWYKMENVREGAVAPIPEEAVSAFQDAAGCT